MNYWFDIYVFSYNRGGFLDNCLKSIKDLIKNCNVNIIDDNSSDIETIQVINKWSKEFNVCVLKHKKIENQRVGGLSKNMEWAFNDARTKGTKFVLFIQDDMQLVRKITESDFLLIERFFEKNLKSIQINVNFMKSDFIQSDEKYTYLDNSSAAYFRDDRALGSNSFSDVGIFNVKRYFELLGKLEDKEHDNIIIAKNKGLKMGMYIFPFMMFLPFPIHHRGKKNSLKEKIILKFGGAGFHPFEYMDKNALKKLFERELNILPVAEKFLFNPSVKEKNWHYTVTNYVLESKGGVYKLLGALLRRL